MTPVMHSQKLSVNWMGQTRTDPNDVVCACRVDVYRRSGHVAGSPDRRSPVWRLCGQGWIRIDRISEAGGTERPAGPRSRTHQTASL